MGDTATKIDPTPKHEVLIRHGLFRFWHPEAQVVGGELKEVLVERQAFHNERVKVGDMDYERGKALGAFWTEPQARAHYAEMGIPAPLLGQASAMPQPEEQVEDAEVEITELDEDELTDWLMSAGQFDGEPKPTVAQVAEAMQEGGPEFAATLHKAEVRASGDAPRKEVTAALEKVQATGTS
jgi:hypothetical protein